MNSRACPYCGQPIGADQLRKIAQVERDQEKQVRQTVETEFSERAAVLEKGMAKASEEKEEMARHLQEVEAGLESRIVEATKAATANIQSELERAKEDGVKLEAVFQKRVEAAEKKARHDAESGFSKDIHDKDEKLASLQRTIDTLQKKLYSQPAHELGKFQEDDLVRLLQQEFPRDRIERNPRSSGADIIHEVMHRGHSCGAIVYESKNAANWSNEWISKLKADSLKHDAAVCILASSTFPARTSDLTFVDDVPVVHPRFLPSFVRVVRDGLVQLMEQTSSGKDGGYKLEQLMNYLQSPEFRNRIQSVVGGVRKLETLQEKEQRAHDKTWKEQARLHKVITASTAEVDEEIRAIILGN